ncbi:MAG: GNAT family N-acetyltransferase [Spirochaetales bacterium]|nr:GNAT family N-acetyltransferase [Spirochaetales bacterium]
MIEYSLLQPPQASQAYDLIRRVYDEFVAPDYPPEGNEHFYTFIQPEVLIRRFSAPGHFLITADEGNRLVGVIAVRDNNHIALLFVDREYQSRGIARKLLAEAEERIAAETGKRQATVFSSPYAVPIYQKLGFQNEGPKQTKDGITFQPMKHLF